jgi:hypothetical protein
MSTGSNRRKCIVTRNAILICFLLVVSPALWSTVFIRWTSAGLPAAETLGLKDLVVSWNSDASSLLEEASKKGYRVYAEVSVQQATAVAKEAAKNGWSGIIVTVPQADRPTADSVLTDLRSGYPRLRFLVATPDGKQPEMRGSLVIKREAVLEVSSPTAQPWIDSNLALARIQHRAYPKQVPLFKFSANASGSNGTAEGPSVPDYLLPVAEAGAFHADVILDIDQSLQKGLSAHSEVAWDLWSQMRSYTSFYADHGESLEPAANIGVVTDDLDTGDEVVNLLARHNIPFRVLLPPDLHSPDVQRFDVFAVFAKPDKQTSDQLADLAARGKTIVLVDAHGSYPWQKSQPAQLNEHAVSYAVGSGKVLELSEPVSDPETFAQDIRRLVGKQNTLISLWNGLTTIAVPYRERGGTIKTVEFINYAEEPVRVQVQVKGSFSSIRYESPQSGCCKTLNPVKHDGFTEFVIPDLTIAGRVHLNR